MGSLDVYSTCYEVDIKKGCSLESKHNNRLSCLSDFQKCKRRFFILFLCFEIRYCVKIKVMFIEIKKIFSCKNCCLMELRVL